MARAVDVALTSALEQARAAKRSRKVARDRRVCAIWNGSNTMVEIATAMSMSVKTVSAVLRKAGLTVGAS